MQVVIEAHDGSLRAWQSAARLLTQRTQVVCTGESLRWVCQCGGTLLFDRNGRLTGQAGLLDDAVEAWVVEVSPAQGEEVDPIVLLRLLENSASPRISPRWPQED